MATKRTTGSEAAAAHEAATASKVQKATRTVRRARKPAQQIRSWQDDPGGPDSGNQPVQGESPTLARARLPIAIAGPGPASGLYDVGTPEFRYWAAAEALGRSAATWSSLLPAGVTWVKANGKLPIGLDDGEDLNAYYDRRGLHFFHATVAGRVVYSGESPDVCSHELGHAVLDALRPQLWGASFIEASAFTSPSATSARC